MHRWYMMYVITSAVSLNLKTVILGAVYLCVEECNLPSFRTVLVSTRFNVTTTYKLHKALTNVCVSYQFENALLFRLPLVSTVEVWLTFLGRLHFLEMTHR